jgi:hypothetical protein
MKIYLSLLPQPISSSMAVQFLHMIPFLETEIVFLFPIGLKYMLFRVV